MKKARLGSRRKMTALQEGLKDLLGKAQLVIGFFEVGDPKRAEEHAKKMLDATQEMFRNSLRKRNKRRK